MKIGYMRVSKQEQNEELQIDALIGTIEDFLKTSLTMDLPWPPIRSIGIGMPLA